MAAQLVDLETSSPGMGIAREVRGSTPENSKLGGPQTVVEGSGGAVGSAGGRPGSSPAPDPHAYPVRDGARS